VTEVFANLARIAARARGMAELRMLVLPHPMETRAAEEIDQIVYGSLETLQKLLTSAP